MIRSRNEVQYRTAAVAPGDIRVNISATGNPNAVVTVNVGSQVSGIILALYADFNSKVTKGELIARIDPAPFQAKVDQAQANVDVGQTVAASLAAPTLFLIAQDLTKMQVDTNVSEADVARLRVGQLAAFSVDAYPGRIFAGSVTSIRQAPIKLANVITYDAVVGISNLDLNLFPGIVNHRVNVLRVSNAALRYRPAADTSTPAPGKGAAKGTALEKSIWILDADNKAACRPHHRRNRWHLH